MELLAVPSQDSLQAVLVLAAVLFVGLTGYCVWYSRMVGKMTTDQRLAHSYLTWPVIILLGATMQVLLFASSSDTLAEAIAYLWNELQFW